MLNTAIGAAYSAGAANDLELMRYLATWSMCSDTRAWAARWVCILTRGRA